MSRPAVPVAIAALYAYFAGAAATGSAAAAAGTVTTTFTIGATAAAATTATITVSSAPAAATGIVAWYGGLSIAGKAALGATALIGSASVTAGVYKVNDIIRKYFNEKELKTLDSLQIIADRNQLNYAQAIQNYQQACKQNAEKQAAETAAVGRQLLEYCQKTGLDINAATFSAHGNALRSKYSIHVLAVAQEPVKTQAKA